LGRKVEAFALLGVGGICLFIYLALILVLLIGSGKVAKAPAVSPSANGSAPACPFGGGK
jgi:hypothetical protein